MSHNRALCNMQSCTCSTWAWWPLRFSDFLEKHRVEMIKVLQTCCDKINQFITFLKVFIRVMLKPVLLCAEIHYWKKWTAAKLSCYTGPPSGGGDKLYALNWQLPIAFLFSHCTVLAKRMIVLITGSDGSICFRRWEKKHGPLWPNSCFRSWQRSAICFRWQDWKGLDKPLPASGILCNP